MVNTAMGDCPTTADRGLCADLEGKARRLRELCGMHDVIPPGSLTSRPLTQAAECFATLARAPTEQTTFTECVASAVDVSKAGSNATQWRGDPLHSIYDWNP